MAYLFTFDGVVSQDDLINSSGHFAVQDPGACSTVSAFYDILHNLAV